MDPEKSFPPPCNFGGASHRSPGCFGDFMAHPSSAYPKVFGWTPEAGFVGNYYMQACDKYQPFKFKHRLFLEDDVKTYSSLRKWSIFFSWLVIAHTVDGRKPWICCRFPHLYRTWTPIWLWMTTVSNASRRTIHNWKRSLAIELTSFWWIDYYKWWFGNSIWSVA